MRKRLGRLLFASGAAAMTLGVLTPGTAFAHADRCPEGWSVDVAQGPTDPFDQNGNGIICQKFIPGEGKGNSGQREGTAEVGHVPGHNEKDDHVHS